MKTKAISQSGFFSARALASLLLVAVSSVLLLLGNYPDTAVAQSPKRKAIQGYTRAGKPILREQQPNSVPHPLTPECDNSWSLTSSLDWAPVADWDLHLQTPNAHIYYGNMSADGFTLNQDANPACAPTPLPPEQITGMGQCGTYTLYSNLYSTCGGSPPITFSATVTALKPITINGASYDIGQTFHPQDGVSFTVAFGAPVITSPLTATATQGQLFVYQVTATGSPTSYTASPLPAPLTFDTVHGIIGGTPRDPGTTQIQLTASNSFGTGTATLTLTVQPAPSSGPVIISGTSITARTGQPFSFEVFTTGGSATARLSATGLPPGLSVDPVTGIISGTSTADGSFGVILTVTDGDVTTTSTLELTFTSDPAIPVIISPRETTLAAGQFFTYTIMAPSSNQSGTTFTLIGNLPLGLSFDAATGTISGTYNPGDQNGGALLGNVQLIATNSSGTATSTLAFFQQVPGTAKNISTRLAVGTSDNVLIGGIIIQGNAPKKVIIRAIGPDLTQYGVPDALQDPFLELHDGSGALIGQNDNWGTTIPGGVITSDQVAEIQASGLAPGDSHESAIISTLEPGNYTAIVRGANNITGAALVEVYDLDTTHLDISVNAQLGNISTRGLVQTGDNVMIGGFIVRGDMPATVIVRAIGPSLTQYGVPNALQDPSLELHDGSGA